MSDVFIMQGRPTDEVFTFEDRSSHPYQCWHFNVSMAQRWLDKHSPGELQAKGIVLTRQPLPVDWIVNTLIPMGTHEEARVKQLTAERIAQPVIGMFWHDGTTVLIDGMHRMIRKYRDGAKTIDMILFPVSMREMFRIDLPGRGTLDIDDPRVPDNARGDLLRKLGVV